ncbi:MAG: major facilitator superfamily transporter [Proteobacteria bacterium]|nr:major facilitator superfamily transporter [Pseudomonadota bacterium]
MLQALKSLPANVWLIGLVSLCNDAASDMLYPLIPLYLSSVLMAGPKALGLIEGVAEATASLLKLFSGVMADRTRSAKPWIVVGYALASFGRPFIALANTWVWVLVIRFADRIGKGMRTSPRDALLAASVPVDRRGVAFGLHRAMDNAGAVVGPLMASALLGFSVPLREIFLWALLPGVITVALAAAIHEPRVAPPGPEPVFSWWLQGLPSEFKRYLLAVGLFTLGNSSNMFLLLRASELGVAESAIPLLWAGVSAIAALLSTHLSAWSDRHGRARFIVAGWAAYGLFYLVMGLLTTGGMALYALFAGYGVFMAATEGVEKALVADMAPAPLRGTAFGWFNLVVGSLLLPASLLFGTLYELAGPPTAFGFSATCAVASALLIRFWVFPPGGKASPDRDRF